MSNVQALIDAAQARTTDLTSSAQSALNTAVGAVQNMGYMALGFTGVPPVAPPPASLALALPVLDGATLELPGEPSDVLTFQDISPIDAGSVPTLSVAAPVFSAPDKPTSLADFTTSAPLINTSIVFPDPPSQLLNPMIDAPVLTDRTEPDRPQTMIPSFTALAPVNDTAAPTDLAGTFQSSYSGAAPSMITMLNGYVDAQLTKLNPQFTAQMAAIEAQLSRYLAGGTGLDPAAENAIYERARSKNDGEARRARDTSYGDAAARGFSLPTGALFSQLQQSRQAAADNNAAGAREIVVMQAEMEQKNLQFAVTTSAGLRATVMNATLAYMQNLGQINGHALDYAKNVLANIIEMYNTAAKAYSLKLDAYRAEAAVFEVRLKGAMAGIDLYREEVQALLAMTQVDRAKVDVYRARIETLSVYANVYRAQIEAVQGRANLEKLKLELFQVQAQTYGVQVQGKNAEWLGYRSAIEGETAKSQFYGSQVQAYGAQVQAYGAQVQAKSEVVRATAITNQARAAQFEAVMRGYQTVVQARGEVARTKLENSRQQVIAFQAQTSYEVSKMQVANEYYRSASMVGIENAKLAISAAVSSADMQRNYASSLAQLYNSNAVIYGNLAGAGLSGLNTLASESVTS